MKKILVPTDFSKTAGNAFTFALEIARRTGAAVHVAHFSRPFDGIDNNIYNALLADEYFEQKKRGLHEWTQKYLKNSAFEIVKVTSGFEFGMAATSIAEMAETGHFDLIVMGTTGASGLRGLLLGSIASGVISAARVPILVVPKNGSFHKMATVALATDLRADLNQRSLNVLKKLLAIEHAGLHVVHVLEKPSDHPDKTKEAELVQNLGGLHPKFHYRHDVSLVSAINDFTKSIDANLLCTISHRHGIVHKLFFGSTSRMLAEQAKLPLLVLYD